MIVVPRPRYDEVIEHALRDRKRECCGILGGSFGEDRSIVSSIHETENVAAMPTMRYEMDPEEQIELFERIESGGESVVGFYHSHPNGPPGPSATDAAQATWPGYSYVIVDLRGQPFLGSWRWQRERDSFKQERVALASPD